MFAIRWNWNTHIPSWLYAFLTIVVLVSRLPTPPVSPAILVYSLQDAPLPFLISPFTIPTWTHAITRVLQLSWIALAFRQGSTVDSEPAHLPFGSLGTTHLLLLAARTGSGFLFARSVGWAYPRLFSHYALYEPVIGLGPLIVRPILFGFLSPFSIFSSNDSSSYEYANRSHIDKRRRRRREDVVRVMVVAGFAFLEAAPWSYACGVAIAGLHHLGGIFLVQWQRTIYGGQENGQGYESIHLSVPQSYDMESLPPPSPHPRANLNASFSRDSKLRTFIVAVVGMSLCWTCGYVPINIPGVLPVSAPGFRQTRPAWTPSSTHPSSANSIDDSFVPGMHILMLTVPRAKDPSSDYMIDSVASYLDAWKDGFPASSGATSWSNATSMLTVYAHPGQNGRHQGFERAETFFRAYPASSSLYLNFFMHPSTVQSPNYASWLNHYNHLSDAIHYAYAAGYEWTMFVEDDFVLCGQPGADGVRRVLLELGLSSRTEPTRKEALEKGAKGWRGAWIGTGGSGLILHHTLLPTLAHLLEVIPSVVSGGSPYPLYPPDVLIQHCLYGDGICGSLYPSLGVSAAETHLPAQPDGTAFLSMFPPSPYPPRHPSRRLITSRLLMGHIGGALSTGGRKYSEGKWACGWRHPDHGQGASGDVGVIVV